MQYYTEYSLKKYNSFRLDSIAKQIYFPESFSELQWVLKKHKDNNILAGGTNVLLKPKINKIICLTKLPKFITKQEKRIFVSPSILTSNFITKMIKKGYKGLEGLVGIPGTLGGAICMNTSSGKYSISDYLHSIKVYTQDGSERIYNKYTLKFGRRYSILQDTKEIINSICFKFKKDKVDLNKLEKAKYHRKSLPRYPSAGGIFVNWHELKAYKHKLIGLREGDAEVSDKVNIIVNKGNATYKDVISLIKIMKKIVNKELKLEIKILG